MHPDSKAFFVALGKRLRELRKAKGWSVRDMVVQHGYFDAQWRNYEKGSTITIDSLLKVAGIFQLSIIELLNDCECGQLPKRTNIKKSTNVTVRKSSAGQAPELVSQ